MKTKTNKLAALINQALAKNAEAPVAGTEITAALDDMEHALRLPNSKFPLSYPSSPNSILTSY